MLDSPQTFLGFDFGQKHIGVAAGQSITKTASPLTTLKASAGQPKWDETLALINEWKPTALVVGIPLNMDGTNSVMADKARRFVRQLVAKTALPVHECDERLTTREAKQILLETYGPKALEKKNIDSFSAKLILESWMRGL